MSVIYVRCLKILREICWEDSRVRQSVSFLVSMIRALSRWRIKRNISLNFLMFYCLVFSTVSEWHHQITVPHRIVVIYSRTGGALGLYVHISRAFLCEKTWISITSHNSVGVFCRVDIFLSQNGSQTFILTTSINLYRYWCSSSLYAYPRVSIIP